jgi:hypothetical protein
MVFSIEKNEIQLILHPFKNSVIAFEKLVIHYMQDLYKANT